MNPLLIRKAQMTMDDEMDAVLMDAGMDTVLAGGKTKPSSFDVAMEKEMDDVLTGTSPKDFSVKKMVSNIPESGYEFGKAVITPFVHPIETAKGLGRILKGIDVKIRKQIDPNLPEKDLENEKYADAVWDFLTERYGGWENIKQTMEKDPVGFTADLSTFVTGAGGLIGKVGQVGQVSKVAKAGQIISKMGRVAEPINVVKRVATAPARLMPAKISQRLYQSGVKLSTKLSSEERAAITKAGMEAKILPTEGGLNKTRDIIDSINDEISQKITQGAARGDTVSTSEIAKRLDDVREFYKETISPGENIKAIDDLISDFKSYHGEKIPVDKAQKLKQNTYVVLRKSYGELKGASIEGQKQLARGIKEELVNLYPEISALNKKESSLIGLEKEIQKAVNRSANRDVIGIGLPIKTAAGAVTGAPAIGLIAGILELPRIKSSLAIVLNRARKVRPTARGAGVRVGAFQAGRGASGEYGEEED